MKSREIMQRLIQIADAGVELQTKRSQASSDETSLWFPYYAGFPDSFVRMIIDILDLPPGSVLLDPWNGSGTTTKVASCSGYQAIGIDINPVANLVAAARLCNSDDCCEVRLRLNKLPVSQPNNLFCDSTDPLLQWMTPITAAQLRRLLHDLLSGWDPPRRITPLRVTPPPSCSLMLLGLLISTRNLVRPTRTTNPTWTIPDGKKEIRYSDLLESFHATVLRMLSDVNTSETRSGLATVLNADVRQLPLPSRSVHLVVTSPPYCTRIDYVVNTNLELAILGMGSDSRAFRRLRRRSMGTPLTRLSELPLPKSQWPQCVQSILLRIRSHPSPDSHSYYYKNFWQYFDDLFLSLRELRRVLEPGGIAIIVAQTSYYKEIPINLPDLVVENAKSIGLEGFIVCGFPVGRVMTSINSRSVRHRSDREYRESVVAVARN